MEENPDTQLISFLQEQMKSLQKKIHELETENAKLSVRLSNCSCQKIAESDKTCALDCSHSIVEVESLQLDESGVNISKAKVPDTCRDTMALNHLPKRHLALKVMYFGQRFYGFASEAQMEPTIESEIFRALQKTRLIWGDKKELHYTRCGRTDKGVSSVGQHVSVYLNSMAGPGINIADTPHLPSPAKAYLTLEYHGLYLRYGTF